MSQVLALDIGGTNVRVALIDDKYQIIKVSRQATMVGNLDIFLTQVSEAIRDLGVDLSQVKAVGIGVPGRVRASGHIDSLPNIKIQDVPLTAYLKERLALPIYIRNDAEMAALAEAKFGAGRGHPSMFFVTISTGLGGAFVRDGRLSYASDEVGHTLFKYQGKHYELEQLASGSGIVRLSALNGLSVTRAQEFFALLEKSDAGAMRVYEDWIILLVKFVAMVQTLFEPAVIAVTGGVMRSKHLFFEDLKRRVPGSILKPAEFGDDAGLIGAANYAFDR